MRWVLAALISLGCAACVAGQDPSLLVGGLPRWGRGSDGPLDSNGNRNTNVNTVLTAAWGEAGARTLSVDKTDELIAGTLVLVHDSQGAGAGVWELALIERVGAGTLTLTKPLQHGYPKSDHAQAVRVLQHDVITLRSGDGMTAPNWNGSSGGIVALMASVSISIDGDLHQNGAGFRGTRHDAGCPMTWQCMAGVSGESARGAGAAGATANGSGGGGGGIGECNQGGGGAYGGAGVGATASSRNGVDGCEGSGSAPGGAGAAAGSDALGESILFGGAGGEGGGDDDSVAPGAGGDGGGIIMLWAPTITVSGHIGADGSDGGGGTAGGGRRTACASDCGAGGGGGGAGGAIYLAANKVSITGTVTARGGQGGACSCDVGDAGGAGGVGRVGVRAQDVSGVSTPPLHALGAVSAR